MEANLITLARIVLVFFTVVIFEIHWVYTSFLAMFLVVIVLFMDSLDGYVARKLKVASAFGALFDITGDRIIENVFWIYFAVIGIIPLWVPLVVISRSFLVDSVRAVAYRKGQTAFGKKTMMKSAFTKFLTASSYSRSLYGGLKIVVFTLLGFHVFLKDAIAGHGWIVSPSVLNSLAGIINILIYATVSMCIIRGFPVLWDGREVLFEKNYPSKLEIG